MWKITLLGPVGIYWIILDESYGIFSDCIVSANHNPMYGQAAFKRAVRLLLTIKLAQT